jgi:type I restriction enzyme S subunit
MESASTSAGQLTINRETLDSLPLLLPPVSEQQRIIALIQEQLSAVDAALTAAEAELEAINTLPAALLRRAFKGEI